MNSPSWQGGPGWGTVRKLATLWPHSESSDGRVLVFSSLLYFRFNHPRTLAHGMGPPVVRVVFPLRLNLSWNTSQTYAEVCLLRAFKSSQGCNQNWLPQFCPTVASLGFYSSLEVLSKSSFFLIKFYLLWFHSANCKFTFLMWRLHVCVHTCTHMSTVYVFVCRLTCRCAWTGRPEVNKRCSDLSLSMAFWWNMDSHRNWT